MNISPQIEKSYKRLQNKLSELLSNQNPQLTVQQKGEYPLLVMETSSDSAGFTIVNGSPENSYTSAYTTFKLLYRENHETWKKRNLSFIVCSQGDLKKNESLFSSIESDVYFCRKYVVRFPTDQEGLEQELRRLPFLPLDEDYPKDIDRPISAQSLLQNLGISTTLSRHLIVSGQRSAKGIIEDLMEKLKQLPDIDSESISQTNKYIEPIKRTRIKSAVVEGFRAYNKKQEFDLDADIIIIYGPNGYGKTSFFDAIDYVSTGRIGRLRKHYKNLDTFIGLVRNLASKKAGHVTIKINQGDSNIDVRRDVDDWSYALSNGEKLDRWNTLQKLSLASWEEKRERIEILERLFRATHLFSQSNPELLSDFEIDSNLSFDIVSRALALDDYAIGLSKVEEIKSILEKYISERNKDLENLEADIKNLKDQRNELPDSEKEEIVPKLKKMTDELKRDIRTHTIINVEEETEITKDVIREWRSLTDAELNNYRESHKQLQKLESNYPQFENDKKSLDEKNKQLKNINIQTEKLRAEKKQYKNELNKLQSEITENKNTLNRSKSKNRAISKFKELKKSAKDIEENLNYQTKELNRINKEISEVEANFKYLISDFEKLGTKKNEIEEVIEEKSNKIQILSEIEKDIKTWEKLKNEMDELQKSITVLESDLKQASESINKEGSFIKKYEEENFEIEQRLEKLTSNKAQLSSLLDEIERYIKDGVCPVCGTDHNSKDNLLEKIHEQKETRPEKLEELVKKSKELKNSIGKRKELVTKSKHTQEVKNDEKKDLSVELNEKQETIEKFESLLEMANLLKDEKRLSETVMKLLDEESSILDDFKVKLKEINKEESNKLKQKTEFELKHEQLVENRQHTNAKIEDLKKQMENYHLKAQELDMPLDISKTEFALIQDEWAELESELSGRLKEFIQNEETLKEDIRKVEKLLSETLQNSESYSEEIEKLQSGLERYEEVAIRFIKVKEITFENISELRKDTEEHISELQRLIHQILTLERALDSAELSVMVAELDSKITIKSNKKLQVKEEVKKFTELRKWFIKIKDVLNKQSSNAVENHVLTLGPLSSLIQKRLRTVYGFGDISLFPEGNTIRVEVDYNGEKVKPTDYFSDSQKQILMLSLFLSGRLTQMWSGFAPILLDDPVTHFDDLNAFGFVELIRGLVSTSPGKRQFIISTCEERLFELMKSKFGKINGGAIFYRFSGINTDGPIVTKIEH